MTTRTATRALQLTALVLTLAGTRPHAGDAVTIQVNPTVTYAPANLFVKTNVEANTMNRSLEVAAESDAFYRSSTVQLDGQNAPRTAHFQFHGLPAGDYAVRATLRGVGGEEIAHSEVKANVMASGFER